ncbi:peptidase inhibitor family I36 protein [Nocardia sp. GTS18]|uniref:peptidase inhibitor family I36 protein n=1 Tax=Nocardia sp. GTS18 TaxID=1778064 RepID=UPI0015EF731A|nr:peptidase inhibitor family I36 protein [Nocardia sp. GTS18]
MMSVRRILAALTVAAAAATTGTVLYAAPAAAQPCPEGKLCLWVDPDAGGRALTLGAGQNIAGLEQPYFQNVNSLFNNTDQNVCFYTDPDFTGDSVGVAGHQFIGDTETELPIGSNISSVRWETC